MNNKFLDKVCVIGFGILFLAWVVFVCIAFGPNGKYHKAFGPNGKPHLTSTEGVK